MTECAERSWKKLRLRYLITEIDDRAGEESDLLSLLSVSIHRGVLPRDELTDRESRADAFSNHKVAQAGEIVVNRMRAFEGGAGISPTRGMVSSDYAVLRCSAWLEPRFLHHLIRSKWFIGEMTARLRGIGTAELGNVRTPRINVSDLYEIEICLPPIGQQRAIADYLDAETARIDALVAARRRQLALLAERRFEGIRALFAARGDNQMRLAWLPPIPREWPVVHLRWLAQCLDGRRIPVNREERAGMQGAIPYWGANGVVDHVDRALFYEPLVLLGEDGAPFFDPTKPKAFFVKDPVWVNNHIHVLHAIGVRPRYLSHYLNLVDYADFVEGSTRDKLTQDNMGSIPVPVPPMAEQQRLESEAEAVLSAPLQIETELHRQIDLLLERRQALITAAVTGQLEIPRVAA